MSLFYLTTGLLVTWAVSLPALSAYRRGRRWESRAFLAWGWVAYTCAFGSIFTAYGPALPGALAMSVLCAGAIVPVLALLDQRDRRRTMHDTAGAPADPRPIAAPIAPTLTERGHPATACERAHDAGPATATS